VLLVALIAVTAMSATRSTTTRRAKPRA